MVQIRQQTANVGLHCFYKVTRSIPAVSDSILGDWGKIIILKQFAKMYDNQLPHPP